MYKLILLILILPMSVFAQEENLYLSAGNNLSTQKSDFRCELNTSKSREYARCYDCIDASGKIVKELNKNLFIMKSLTDSQSVPYFKLDDKNAHYLIGDLKDGKPWNGFFKQPGGVMEFKIYAFYKDGAQVYQIYHDNLKDMLTEKESGPYSVIQEKNTYQDGKLFDGMELVDDKNGDSGMGAIRFVKAGKTERTVLGLFAMHYAELIDVRESPNGYSIESLGRGGVKIGYSPKGRTLDFYDTQKKDVLHLDYTQLPFDQVKQLDQNKPITYFSHHDQLFVEQMTSMPKDDEQLHDKYTKIVFRLVQQLYVKAPLDSLSLLGIISEKVSQSSGIPLGYFAKSEWEAYGVWFSKGETTGKYNVDYYESGKISPKSEFKIRNKSLKEIALILQGLH
ncbi:hypothetical protein [Pedobacter sp. MC2016-24]|uniref:hypothetical protein n=1 Tax=Pedobacter sp. MC2016-24 TaxID=2780090 RepID=UPI00187F9760|nr:hypothetical protein [Pedobacter sp. MC2016-24]MBE9600893.1 hypothetical protein [Pedobacter sp. MC2016-24]